jgi:hypothetical protein
MLKTKILSLESTKFCQNFAKRCCFPEDKKRGSNVHEPLCKLFRQNDQFEETNFLNEVLDNPDLIPEFKNYKVERKNTVSRMSLHFLLQTQQYLMHENQLKVINLDTNIQIKMDFINPESAENV